jgi:pilus assembly protein CpaC
MNQARPRPIAGAMLLALAALAALPSLAAGPAQAATPRAAASQQASALAANSTPPVPAAPAPTTAPTPAPTTAAPTPTSTPAPQAAPAVASPVIISPPLAMPVATTAPSSGWPSGPSGYAPLPVSAANGPPIVLTKGAMRALDFNDPVTRIIVTDGSVVDASVLSERQVRLNPLKAGRTYVTVTTLGAGPATYAVSVVPDLSAVQTLLSRDAELRGLRLSSEDDHMVVSGTVDSVQAHAHAIEVLHAYYGETLIDMIQTGGNQMIAVDIKFAAVQADTLKEIGFNFSALGHGFSFATAGPNAGSSFTQAGNSVNYTPGLPLSSAFNLLFASPNSNILAAISALTSANLSSTLAEPTLLVRSGDQANFLAGGEIPIPVPQSGSGGAAVVTIAYHEYGVQLRIAPTLMGDGRIAMTVAPEVSSIDTANSVTINGYAVPAFLKRSTSTTIELKDGQSFLLAGLLYSTTSINETKFPGLGDLPIIGNFFRYSSNTREKQELVIVATPHIVQPLATAALPPLPGQEFSQGYNPGVVDMLLNRQPADAAAAHYGLMR